MILSENEIHVWFVYDEYIRDTDLLSKYYQILDEKERVQQKRFHFDRHKHQYLVTRAMARSVLSLCEDKISSTRWKFKKMNFENPGNFGKFNLAMNKKFLPL